MPQPGPKPAYKTCAFDDIAAFRPGVWNGEPHSAEFVRKLFDNFKKYSTGTNPYYVPYVSVNHKDEFAAGRVSGARLDGDTLHLDTDDVPEVVGELRKSGAIRQPSIEYFKPVYDETGKLIDGFRRPDGSIEPGPVLKCLTLLGADAPAVKGLPDIPFARYRDLSPVSGLKQLQQQRAALKSVRKFSNAGGSMDRTAIIAALQALGFDVSGITDAVPDPVLQAWLEGAQKLQTGGAPAPTDGGGIAPVDHSGAMADGTGGGAALGGAGGAVTLPTVGAGAGAQPSAITLKFSDASNPATVARELEAYIQGRIGQGLAAHNAALQRLAAGAQQNATAIAAVNREAERQLHVAKFNDVSAFVESLATITDGFVRLTPAQKPATIALLMKCDNKTVRKFADGKTTGSELDEMKAQLSATLPRIRCGDKVPDPHTGTGGNNTVDAGRRERMLKATPQGREILAKEAAAKK